MRTPDMIYWRDDIEELREFEAGSAVVAYYVKGHDPLPLFEESIRNQYDVPNPVARHEYWRNVPAGPDMPGVTCQWPAKGPGRGAFAVTVVWL